MIPIVGLQNSTLATTMSTALLSEAMVTKNTGALFDHFDTCGAEDPDFKNRCEEYATPPTCAEDEACQSDDGCEYRCIKKADCEFTLFNSLLTNGKLLSNCAEEAPYKYSWACDFDQDQHGYATVPGIKRVHASDERNITLLGGSWIQKYEELRETNKVFDNFFQNSTCQGIYNSTDNSVYFSDIFNNQECMPACETITNATSLCQECSVLVGYDDFLVSTSDSSQAVLQRGHSWMLTCTRNLIGDNISDIGKVIDDGASGVTATTEINTTFNLDIHCCDPEDLECLDDCKDTPVFQIGPYAELEDNRFFVSIEVDYEMKSLVDRGFLHVQSCTFQELGSDNQTLSEPLQLLRDGCPVQFGSMSLLENLRERTMELSYRETMDLIPFRIDSGALSFNLTCELLNCPWSAINNDLCKLEDQCFLGDRYEPFTSFLNQWAGRKRRSLSDSVKSETISKSMKHPCSLVREEGDKYCIGDEKTRDEKRDCWTFDLCEKRARSDNSESSGLMTTFSALVLLFSL